MNKIVIFLFAGVIIMSCGRVKEKTKEVINKGGETVGETTTEFFEGIVDGVEGSLQYEIKLSKELSEKGLKTGKITVSQDTGSINDNLLSIYLIADQDLKDTLYFKAFDENKLEVGRSKLPVDMKAGDADYFDVIFDPRTHLEFKSIIEIE